MVNAFSDPAAGCVNDRLTIIGQNNSISESQGIYWKYENRKGRRVVHEDSAVAYDTFHAERDSELKARIGMTLKNITCTLSKYRSLKRATLSGVMLRDTLAQDHTAA